MKHLTLMAMLCAVPAQADIIATFSEGAPKDRFTIRNESTCAVAPGTITIDLAGSAAGLVFDVTDSGAGVEVFQPFEVVAGANLLRAVPLVKDGDTQVSLAVTGLAPGQSVAFTIDVDDTLGTRAITVSGGEIEGASVAIMGKTASFNTQAKAVIADISCKA